MQINFVYDSSVSSAPSGFKPAMERAAQNLDALITNDITVTIQVGWGEDAGAAVSSGATGGPTGGTFVTYSQLIADLTQVGDSVALGGLPATSPLPTSSRRVELFPAQEKALGLLPANTTEVDGSVGFATSFTNADFNFDGTDPSAVDFVGVAEHELTHAMGRLSLQQSSFTTYSLLDLYRYSAPGVLANLFSTSPYFSLDKGATNLRTFDTVSDYGDWARSTIADSFKSTYAVGVALPVSSVDRSLLAALGFSIAADRQALAVLDTTLNQAVTTAPQTYTGPVAGLQSQFINITADNLNIAVSTPGWFIHSGSGTDAITVSSGTNVVDGGTGSNFLTGGTGTDTFFIDDRNAAADIWSTVNNFHAGDSATIWGVTQAGFTLKWVDGEGAAGFAGLTLHASAAGSPTASLTLSGFTSADLSTGRLSVTYGTDAASASPYAYVHANS
jgi:hypothetical protein